MTHQKKPMPIVSLFYGEPLASSEALAAGVNHSHESVIKLVRKHQTSLERFGLVRFEIRPRLKGQHGGGDVEIALLNEPQSTLLITMMRNTAIVIECKVRLVEEFYRMRDALSQQAKGLWQQMQALIAQEVESKIKASFGSRLMLDRKQEIPFFKSEHQRLEAEIQPALPLFH
ncbi:MAG: Rha family transcriptional regulator [Simplicispira sp.]|nr:Rha family transcriptional regulator [Simplicispira sp.]